MLPVRLLANEIWSSPKFVDAVAIAFLSEPLPESLALVTKMGTSDGIESVPSTVRLAITPKYLPPVIRVIFVGHVIGAETVIFPAVALPTVSVLAVIRPISTAQRPSVVLVSVPIPRLIRVPLPFGWMMTLPAVVAFKVLFRKMLLAVREIRPPLLEILSNPIELIPRPVLRFPGVLPVIVTLPTPETEMLELVSR